MGKSMKELLEITEPDIRAVAEKLGWEYNQSEAGVGVAGTTNGIVFIGGMSDTYNAPAILAIERMILKYALVSIGKEETLVTQYGLRLTEIIAQTVRVRYSLKQLNAPNFRTWLIVQIVKRLPKSVFESGQEGGGE